MFDQSQYDQGRNPLINSVDPFGNRKIKAIVTLDSCNGLIFLGISSGDIEIGVKNLFVFGTHRLLNI